MPSFFFFNFILYIYLFIYLFIYLLIYLWLCWVFVAVRRLSLVVASGGYSLLWCAGFSVQWRLLLRSTGSRHEGFSSCGSWALERRLGSCGTRAQLLRGMQDLPGPELEPMSPALAGGFLTTAPSGKSLCLLTRGAAGRFMHKALKAHFFCFQGSFPRLHFQQMLGKMG